MIGKTLNHYKILDSLGRGGMGEVYLAEDTRLRRRIALKVLPEDMARDPERRLRFEREALSVASLNHPNIVTLFSVEEAEGLHFFTMEHVQGQPLSQVIGENGLETSRFCNLAVQLVEAIAAAHDNGVTHRDLKPANVMVSSANRVKVLDFGLAKLRESEGEDAAATLAGDDLTQIGRVIGTAAYMSPEQAEGKPVDERSDIFSLGILLYQMGTGRKPFEGDTQISLMSSILKDAPLEITDLKPDCPARLGQIIRRCLEKAPADRYQSAHALLDDLVELKREMDTGDLLASQTSMSPASQPRSPSGFWKLTGFAVLAVTLGGLGYLGFRAVWPSQAVSELADARRGLAVFYFQNITGDDSLDWLRTGLTDMLVTDLSQSPNLRVLGTDRLYQILDGMNRLDEPQISVEVVEAVAKQAGIGTAILGSFVKAGETLRINVRLQDTESGEVIASERTEGEGEQAVFEMVDDLTRLIKKRMALASLQDEQSDRDLVSVTTDSVQAYRDYLEGVAHHERGDEEKAIPMLEKAVEVDESFAMALAKLSVSYGNQGDQEKARDFAKQALEHIDRLTDRERYYIEGRYFSLDPEGQEKAVAAYEKAVELFPDHNAARNNLASLYIDQERHDEAIAHLERLREDQMTFPGTYVTLARAYAARGDYQTGLEVLQEYSDRQPDNAVGLANLGQGFINVKRYDEAIEVLEAARKLNRNVPLVQLWSAYTLAERWDDARAAVRQMQQGELEQVVWAGNAFGAILETYSGRVETAVDLFQSAAEEVSESSPLRAQSYLIAALFKLELNRIEDAKANAQRVIAFGESEQNFSGAHAVMAIAEALSGNDDKSREHAEVVLEVSGDNQFELLGLATFRGNLALVRKDYEQAIRWFTEALPLFPSLYQSQQSLDLADTWYGLGLANYELGRTDEAEKWFRTLAESGPERVIAATDWVRSHYFLGVLAEKRGDAAAARRHFQRYHDFWKDAQVDRDRIREVGEKLGIGG